MSAWVSVGRLTRRMLRGRPGRAWPALALLAIAALAALLFLPGGAVQRLGGGSDETWARVQREGVFRIGMDASYPPFDLEDSGQFQGYDVDLAREIGRRLGLQVTFVNVSFDGLYDGLAAGRYDAIISALPYDPQRVPDVLYTGGYWNAGQVIVTRADEAGIQAPADLAGRAVAVEMGSTAHSTALDLRDRDRLPLTIVTAQSSDEAFDLLQAGKADAAIADRITARLAARQRGGLALRGSPLTDESFVIAVRRSSPQLFRTLSGALDGLRGEGWLEKLADRWL